MRPQSRVGKMGKSFLKLKEKDKATFFSPEVWCLPAPSSTKPQEREFVVDSGASMHMLSRKDQDSAGTLESIRVSRKPTTVITANGVVQINEEATVYVYDLDLFVTAQILEDTPVVLSLGKLCEDHGCSYEWTSCQKPHLIRKKTAENTMQNGKLRVHRCSGIINRTSQLDYECIFNIGTAGLR